ncbi:hypothetical protein CL176_06230 [Suicoccus acidiformans]|uniref:Uncharacterized protein n=1 Tax=Suicoccus acidiformans TaxID=2036206 RepID=A0A347WKL7_9LACT|nr:hypothetical protein [Suicoccus acidiformans]AXY25624.1 hypothetical protein CL176_06230 [Suicoccus acidiformans]
MIRYGDSSLAALWKPNDFRFFKQEYAEKIAKIFQDQGKVFDYEIVPDETGYYKNKTHRLIFHDDQNFFTLIP